MVLVLVLVLVPCVLVLVLTPCVLVLVLILGPCVLVLVLVLVPDVLETSLINRPMWQLLMIPNVLPTLPLTCLCQFCRCG